MCVLLLPLLYVDALAQDARYSKWKTGEDSVQELARELNALIDEAERASAADPLFLRDLRDKLASYARPERIELLRDDFSDGNFTRNPSWTVVDGEFTVDPNLGLRSTVQLAQANSSSEPKKKSSIEEVAGSLLGDLFGDKKKGGGERAAPADTGPTRPARAEIYLAQPIGNAFSLQLEFVSGEKTKGGRFEVDIYQGGSRTAGYRLAYRSR
jgi:hypothetical protein